MDNVKKKKKKAAYELEIQHKIKKYGIDMKKNDI